MNETSLKNKNLEIKTTKKRSYSLTTLKKIQPIITPELTSNSYCVIEARNNEIVLSQNATISRQIASLTKLMTAFSVINICSKYGIHVKNSLITIHHEASSM